jgi:hypothetical protein
LIYVVNSNRPYVSTLEGAEYTLRQIEDVSRLNVTGIINNANIGRETSMNDIEKGFELSVNLAEKLNIPFLYTTISTHLMQEAEAFSQGQKVRFIERFMKVPWEI